jgi:hypothetical protein
MTSPSTPALLAMSRHGATSAFSRMDAPSLSSSSLSVAANSYTGNIQGTFREHLGNIQGTFSAFSRMDVPSLSSSSFSVAANSYTGNIQGTFRAHSGHIQGTFREHSGNIQCELSGRP